MTSKAVIRPIVLKEQGLKHLLWKEATRRVETGTTLLHVPSEKYTADVRRHVLQACENLKRDLQDADDPDEPF